MIKKNAAVITTLTVLLAGVPVVAQHTPVCYMQSKDGQIMNLESLCGSSTSKPIDSLSTKDRQFVEDYKRSLMGLKDSPDAQAALSSIAPQSLIGQANEVCNALNAGTFIEFRRAQIAKIAGSGNPQSQRLANLQARTIQTVAPKSYCPEFDN